MDTLDHPARRVHARARLPRRRHLRAAGAGDRRGDARGARHLAGGQGGPRGLRRGRRRRPAPRTRGSSGSTRRAVAIGSQASALVGVVAASVPDGAEVLAVDGDFASVVFPFLAHADRGVTVRHVPLESAGRRGPRRPPHTSRSRSCSRVDGRVADVDAVRAAAAARGRPDRLRRHAGRRLAARSTRPRSTSPCARPTSGSPHRAAPRSSRSGPSCSTGCARRAPAGTRARRSGRRSTARRCALARRRPPVRRLPRLAVLGGRGRRCSRRSPRPTADAVHALRRRAWPTRSARASACEPGGSAIVRLPDDAAGSRRALLAAHGTPRGGPRRRRPARVPRLERRRRRRRGLWLP